jgi:hypothetical protein
VPNSTPELPIQDGSASDRGLWRDLLSWQSLLGTIGLLAGLEIGFRLLSIGGPPPVLRVDTISPGPSGSMERVDFGYIPDATVHSVYASDPRGYFGPGNQVDHKHSSIGLRERELTEKKPQGTLRVLGLGDSYLWGQGVRRQDLLLRQLETSLEDQRPDQDIETINTALPSMNTWWQLALLKDYGLKLDPDLVILFFVVNDVEDKVWEEHQSVEAFRAYSLMLHDDDTLSQWSNLWRWSRQNYTQAFSGKSFIKQSVDNFSAQSNQWMSCRTALLHMKQTLDAEQVPFMLVIFPIFYDLDGDYPFKPIHDVVGDFARSQDIEVLDLSKSFPGYSGPELWVHPTDHHPNEIAHKIAADAVDAHIEAHPELLGR